MVGKSELNFDLFVTLVGYSIYVLLAGKSKVEACVTSGRGHNSCVTYFIWLLN